MPGVYIIHLDPSFPPVQHTRRKVPIECSEPTEKLLQDMVNQGIINPITVATKWVSSLVYPQKPDEPLCMCLYPRSHYLRHSSYPKILFHRSPRSQIKMKQATHMTYQHRHTHHLSQDHPHTQHKNQTIIQSFQDNLIFHDHLHHHRV